MTTGPSQNNYPACPPASELDHPKLKFPEHVHLQNFSYSGNDIPNSIGSLRKVITRDENDEVQVYYHLSLYRETFSTAKPVRFNPKYKFNHKETPYNHSEWSEYGILETKDVLKFTLGEGQIDDGNYSEWFCPFV